MTNLEYEDLRALIRRCVKEEISRYIEHDAKREGIENVPRPDPFIRAGAIARQKEKALCQRD